MKLFHVSTRHITEVADEDVPALANIHASCFNHAWSEDDIAITLNVKGTNCLVARQSKKYGNIVRGFLMYRSIGEQGEILTIAVDPKFRRLGIARSLIENAVRRLQSDRVEQFFLEVNDANLSALALYKSLSFKQISIRKGYYRSNNTDNTKFEAKSGSQNANALVMKLDLR